MNLVRNVIKKPFSIGAVLFVYPPLLAIALVVLYFGIRYWYIALGAFVFLCMIAGTQVDRAVTQNEKEDSEITAMQMRYSAERQKILWQLHNIGVGNSPEHERLWAQVEALKAEEAEFLQKTEVVNLDPLGHNIGRRYKC